MNGCDSVSHGSCKFCDREIIVEYNGKHFDYCSNCDTEKKRLVAEIEEQTKMLLKLETLSESSKTNDIMDGHEVAIQMRMILHPELY